MTKEYHQELPTIRFIRLPVSRCPQIAACTSNSYELTKKANPGLFCMYQVCELLFVAEGMLIHARHLTLTLIQSKHFAYKSFF